MGIENRDYARGGGSSGSGYGGGYVSSYGGYRSGMPPACKWILIITIAVFVVQLLWTSRPSEEAIREKQQQLAEALDRKEITPAEAQTRFQLFIQPKSVIQRYLELDAEKVVPGFQVWRLVTYAFCHAREDVLHIVFNMLALWFFGPTLERMYGTREFTWFYLMGSAAAGLAFIVLDFLMIGVLVPVIGASGAVMAVLMLYAIHYPRHCIYIMGIIPIEARWIVGIYLVYDLYPVLLALGGDAARDNVAHSAHLGGLAFGYLYYKFQWRFDRFFSNFKLPEMPSGRKSGSASRGNLKLYQPPENIEAQVDEILEKISRSGEASLTDQERELLKAASQRYKKRL